MRAAQSNPNISIVGVNDPFIPVDYMRYMLKYDTVHGRFPNTVEVAGDSIAVGGDKVKVFGERDPSRAVWKSTSELGCPTAASSASPPPRRRRRGRRRADPLV